MGNESTMRRRWRKKLQGYTTGRDHAAANQVPMCWSLDFNWTTFDVTKVNHPHTPLRHAQNSTFPGPSETFNHRVSQGVSGPPKGAGEAVV